MNLQISIAPATQDASLATKFKSENVKVNNLEEILKSHNYSLINWKTDDSTDIYNRYRKSENFESASGYIVDIDDGLTIDDAKDKLDSLGLNYVMITSKSHQVVKKDKPAIDRFHIIVPFNKPLKSKEKYQAVFGYFAAIFPSIDSSTRDLARFYFASPNDSICVSNLDNNYLDVDEIKTSWNLKEISKKIHRNYWEFDPSMEITLANGKSITASEITSKKPCYCPKPEHEDNTPSAFIDYVKDQDKHMIYCSSCDSVGWSDVSNFEIRLADVVDDFYFYGKDIVEFGVNESVFYATKTSRDAYYILVGANDQKKQENALRYIVENKRLSNLARVDYVGDVAIEKDQYNVNLNDGVIKVSVAALPVDIQDNAFIDDYLSRTFGKHVDFIKKYLAMYVYTNYIQLPTMILHGPRGTSKTTFAEMVRAIFPNLYIDWRGDVGSFTPEAEKKLAVIEENELNEKSQYKILKKYSGQKYLLVNKKYQPEYQVRNNLNIILISNESIPLFVEKTELPTDESNNQFFVWKLPDVKVKRDGTFSTKLKKRLGHYIRTELKDVFDKIDKNYTRYGIEVPITKYEKELFESNVTNIEASTDYVMEKIYNYYHEKHNRIYDWFGDYKNPSSEEIELFEEGKLVFSLIQKFATNGVHPNAMIKNLKKRGIIEDGGRVKKGSMRYTYYQIIDPQYVVKSATGATGQNQQVAPFKDV